MHSVCDVCSLCIVCVMCSALCFVLIVNCGVIFVLCFIYYDLCYVQCCICGCCVLNITCVWCALCHTHRVVWFMYAIYVSGGMPCVMNCTLGNCFIMCVGMCFVYCVSCL